LEPPVAQKPGFQGRSRASALSPNARELLAGADAGGELALVGDEHRQAVLYEKADGAPGADEHLSVAAEGRLAGRIDGAAEECEEFVHGPPWEGKRKDPAGVSRRGLCISLQAGSDLVRAGDMIG
jgi:hypothetical protein